MCVFLHAGGCIIVMPYITEVIWLVKVHHQHWHQSNNVEGEACIDRREEDEEGVSGGQENGDRCRDVGRMVVALIGGVRSFAPGL